MTTSIKLSKITKHRLELLKSKSFDNTLKIMLDYFDATGINPKSKIATPAVDIKYNANRIIQILRAMERTYFKPLDKSIEILLNVQNEMNITAPNVTHSDATNKDIETVIKTNESLKKTILMLEKQLQEKTSEVINKDLDVIPKSVLKNKIEGVYSKLNEIESKLSKSNIETGKLIISENFFNQKMRMIKSELKELE